MVKAESIVESALWAACKSHELRTQIRRNIKICRCSY